MWMKGFRRVIVLCCRPTMTFPFYPTLVFTARYYAERGYEIACRLSVRPLTPYVCNV